MDEKTALDVLMKPLYGLFHLENIERFAGVDAEVVAKLTATSNQQPFRELVEALAWASERPEVNYAGTLPHLPHDNPTIYAYLVKLHQQLAPLLWEVPTDLQSDSSAGPGGTDQGEE